MRFELTEYHKQISTEELLQDLKDTAHKLNVISMSMQEYDLNGTYSSSAVVRRFGSWNHALELSGLEYRNRYFEEIELFENLEKVWIKIGKQPTRRDMDDKNISNISSGAYLRKFGKWSVALKRFVEFVDKTYDISNTDERTTFTHKTKRDVNLRLRFLVMQRDNFKCCSCGASPAKDPNVILHIDHIISWSKGGETVIDNLQTLCSKCNLGKSNTFFE
ncbi:MAG: HNH endonuclease [Oscillospiraceae bacterium]|nr:HNH endonuclease [Oscillospiraceae bacterium]